MSTTHNLESPLFASLPPAWPEELSPLIRQTVAACRKKLVVLDDDPTGTQTVYDIPVLTCWDVQTLLAEFHRDGPCFYLLTNSRSLTADGARALNIEIAQNLQAAAHQAGREFVLVSRSDSTLRGHYPVETDALSEVAGPVDATIIAPYFEAGGRYTIGDVHYVAEGSRLIPAAETDFARDAVFGYRNSNLRAWIEEKTGGRVRATEVHSISIEMLRSGTPNQAPTQTINARLSGLPRGSVCIVNACHPRDMDVFALGSLMAERAGARLLYRTAAQFVAARLGLQPRPLWRPSPGAGTTRLGGLIIVGSHVPKTTQQLQPLLRDPALTSIELSVDRLLEGGRKEVIARAVSRMNQALPNGRDVLVYTSRQLASTVNARDNLVIGRRVSSALVEVVRKLESRPRYLVAKGGITSSDVATQGLDVKRALVLGQIVPGVPVWELGPESSFPGLPYIVFPGNVGGPDALAQVVQTLQS